MLIYLMQYKSATQQKLHIYSNVWPKIKGNYYCGTCAAATANDFEKYKRLLQNYYGIPLQSFASSFHTSI